VWVVDKKFFEIIDLLRKAIKKKIPHYHKGSEGK
jgi:hypothetical protein